MGTFYKEMIMDCVNFDHISAGDLPNTARCVYANSAKHWNGSVGGWYVPGHWSLPAWWVNHPTGHGGEMTLDAAQFDAYASWFGHKGGQYVLPPTTTRGQ